MTLCRQFDAIQVPGYTDLIWTDNIYTLDMRSRLCTRTMGLRRWHLNFHFCLNLSFNKKQSRIVLGNNDNNDNYYRYSESRMFAL